MASTTSETELNGNSISKMKVAELKKELKSRGLSTVGAKNELQERLQQAVQGISQDLVLEDGNAESEILDEDEVLGGEEEGGDFDDEEADAVLEDEPKTEPVAPGPAPVATKRPAAPLSSEASQQVQPKKRILVRPISVSCEKENGSQEKNSNESVKEEKKEVSEKKIIKLSAISTKERLELRAQKFGTPLSEAAKKEARAARFAVTSSSKTTIPIDTPSGVPVTKIVTVAPSAEVLKKRAERFGCNVSSFATKLEEQEKLKKRQERFGLTSTKATVSTTAKATVVTASAKIPITMNTDERKKLRAERFKV